MTKEVRTRRTPLPDEMPIKIFWTRSDSGAWLGRIGSPKGKYRFKALRKGSRWELRDRSPSLHARYSSGRRVKVKRTRFCDTLHECRDRASRRLQVEQGRAIRAEAARLGVRNEGYEYIRGLEQRIKTLEKQVLALEITAVFEEE